MKTNQEPFADAHTLYPVDTSRAKDGVWLVKVPKYLADLWQKAGSDAIVGKVVIATSANASLPNNSGDSKRPGSQVSLVTDSELLNNAGETGQLIPKEHQFLIQTTPNANQTAVANKASSSANTTNRRLGPVAGQELIILCEDDLVCSPSTTSTNTAAVNNSSSAANSKAFSNLPTARYHRRLSVFGRVNSRAECRPPPNSRYMKLKARQMEYEMRRKAEGKNMRRDRDAVMQDLFKAYEKHQYYLLKDLVAITRQPTAFLAEILREIAIYHPRAPHKNMWELKPEYRHYSDQEPVEQPESAKT